VKNYRGEEKPGTMEAVVHIGDNLKMLRTLRALTQAELAQKAGLTPATVVRIERNQAEPHMSTIRKLAESLGVDPAELVKGEHDG
jgi:transcriptional regulator with XRE-family HTH domain